MSPSATAAFWHLVTRLGESQILIPTAAALALWLAWRGRLPRLALGWFGALVAAVAAVVASKVAFMGYGIGWAAIDFTGFSGHSMCAAAFYPIAGLCMFGALDGAESPRSRAVGLVSGIALAGLIGISRLAVGAHSPSEVIAGLALGGAVTASALAHSRWPQVTPPLWVPVILTLWLGITPIHAPASPAHGWVTSLALAVSGRQVPYTREDLHHRRAPPHVLQPAAAVAAVNP
jgi:membrane-associated phospholipid phosphatase